jgi:hypothetical protein
MVSDNPESFADLTAHCGTGAPSEPCHDERGHGNSSVEGEPGSSGIVNASCSLESCETYAESSAQGTQIAAQKAAVNVSVTVVAGPEVLTDTKIDNGVYFTGVGALIQFTFTDANGKPIVGASVTESNTTGDGSTPVQNPNTLKTDKTGSISDCVCFGLHSADPHAFANSEGTVSGLTEAVNSTGISRTTFQTLTISVGKNSYNVKWTKTLSNVDSRGHLNTTLNSNGVNVRFSHSPITVSSSP